MLTLAGISAPAAAASSIVAFEEEIAVATLPPDETRDPLKVYNYMSIDALQALTPHLPWGSYFRAIGRPNVTHVIVTVPSFFKALDAVVGMASTRVLNAYTTWCLLHNTASYLSSPFLNETFNFYGKVGMEYIFLQPLYILCVRAL